MIDSVTLSHEAVATLKTDCKELRTTGKGEQVSDENWVGHQASETVCCESDM